jgi:hypothetical protein
MISTLFGFGNEIVEVRINDKTCLFKDSQHGGAFATIDSIKLDKHGCIKEFPDLKDKKDWREKTLERFKKKIKGLKSEEKRMKYIIEDLTKYGYKPLWFQQSGFRPIKIKS